MHILIRYVVHWGIIELGRVDCTNCGLWVSTFLEKDYETETRTHQITIVKAQRHQLVAHSEGTNLNLIGRCNCAEPRLSIPNPSWRCLNFCLKSGQRAAKWLTISAAACPFISCVGTFQGLITLHGCFKFSSLIRFATEIWRPCCTIDRQLSHIVNDGVVAIYLNFK